MPTMQGGNEVDEGVTLARSDRGANMAHISATRLRRGDPDYARGALVNGRGVTVICLRLWMSSVSCQSARATNALPT